MIYWNKICGLISILLFASLFSSAQNKIPTSSLLLNSSANTVYNPGLLTNIIIIPSDYYTKHFGIMCKKELAVEKATRIPIRFRLGSLQQCNYLEGKK